MIGSDSSFEGVRCNACGGKLPNASAVCGQCGVGPQSGTGFWRIFWGGMILSALLLIVVSAAVLIYAPRYAPHLFQPDARNVLP